MYDKEGQGSLDEPVSNYIPGGADPVLLAGEVQAIAEAQANALVFCEQVPPRMGLIDTSTDRWDKFRKKITMLNQELRRHDAEVKVFFFARHGEGWREFFNLLLCFIT